MSVMIKTVNLTKRYGTLVALSNLNLEIHEGDCYGFIGPNGAGKSTTIKILATLLQPTWGEARVCDFVVGYQSRQIRPMIGYVPDYFGAYEDMVVQEYLEFFAAAYGINGPASSIPTSRAAISAAVNRRPPASSTPRTGSAPPASPTGVCRATRRR